MAPHRRQLAEALPLAGAAQLDPSEPSALHGIPADLAEVHSKGHAWALVRVLRRGDGDQLLDRYGVRRRYMGRGGKILDGAPEAHGRIRARRAASASRVRQ